MNEGENRRADSGACADEVQEFVNSDFTVYSPEPGPVLFDWNADNFGPDLDTVCTPPQYGGPG